MEKRFWTKPGFTRILDLPGWIHARCDHNSEEFYGDNVVRMISAHGIVRVDLPDSCREDCLLVYTTKDDAGDDFCVSWLLLEYNGTDCEGQDLYRFLATGEGYAGVLREARHTYIRPYLFYIRPGLFTAVFEALRKWFDFD